MTNEELLIAIAKAKGYGVIKEHTIGGYDIYLLQKDGHEFDCFAFGNTEAEAWKFAPDWPADIAAAMELWDEMKCEITVWFDEVLDVWVAYDKKRDAYYAEEKLPV